MIIKREPFVFESPERAPVERTMKKLNEISTDKTYSMDYDEKSKLWYIFEVQDEDEI